MDNFQKQALSFAKINKYSSSTTNFKSFCIIFFKIQTILLKMSTIVKIDKYSVIRIIGAKYYFIIKQPVVLFGVSGSSIKAIIPNFGLCKDAHTQKRCLKSI